MGASGSPKACGLCLGTGRSDGLPRDAAQAEAVKLSGPRRAVALAVLGRGGLAAAVWKAASAVPGAA
jgi:hypothetical protein